MSEQKTFTTYHERHFGSLRSGTPWNKTSFVYIIRNAELGLYKIGYSDNVDRRLKELQRNSRFTLDIFVAWRVATPAAKAFEWAAHEMYSGFRSHGEWFAFDAETAADLLDTPKWSMPAVRVYPHNHHYLPPLPPNPYHTHLL